MIESVHIRNFRGIQTGQLDRFRQFNLLIGPNNSGKSTLLEALYLAGTASREATLVYTSGETGESISYEVTVPAPDLVGYHPLSQVWGKHNFAKRQAGLGRWREGDILVTVRDRTFRPDTFELLAGGDGFARGEEEVTGLVGIENTDHNREQKVERLVEELLGPDVLPFVDQRLVFLWHRELTYNWKGSAVWLVEGDLPVARRVLFFDVEMMQAHLPLAFYQEMLGIPRWADRIARRFGAIFDIEDPLVQFAPPGAENRWVQGHIGPRDGRLMPVDSYGDGARSAFKVLVPLVTLAELASEDEPGLFLWEEPELFQHPHSLGRLLQEVTAIVREKPIQLFISTQNLEVLAYFAEMLRQGEVEGSEVMTFRLALEDGRLRSSWFEADNLVSWLEDGWDPRIWGSWEMAGPLRFALWEETE